MESTKIPFNHFYQIFNEEFRKETIEIGKKRLGDLAYEKSNIYDLFTATPLSTEDRLSIYNKVLYDICTDYISLSNSSITVLPKDIFETVNLILDTIEDNPYKESFLLSLQFIYQNYFDCLGKGCPVLMSCENSDMPASLQVTLDSRNQLMDFEAINLDLIEEDRIMTKLLSMEINQQQGPIPKVLYRIRKDI